MNAFEMDPDDSYIVLYEHHDFAGATLTIKLRDGLIQTINGNNQLYSRCSSFELVSPRGVQVSLHKWPPGHPDHSKVKDTWKSPDNLVNENELKARNLNDAITCIVWAVDGRPYPDVSRDGVHQTGDRFDDPPRQPGTGLPPAPDDLWCVQFFSSGANNKLILAALGYTRCGTKEEAVLRGKDFSDNDALLKNQVKKIEPTKGYCPYSDVRKVGDIP